MKTKFWILGGALALAVSITASSLRSEAPSPLIPAAQAATEKPFLRREPLDGADVARLLRLDAYKWRYLLPAPSKGRLIWAKFWVEDWRRNRANSKIYGLGEISLPQRGTLMLKSPATAQDDYVVSSSTVVYSAKAKGFSPLISPSSGDSLDRQSIALGRDIILTHKAQNQSGTYSGDPQSVPDYARKNDRTVYVKVRFTQKAAPRF